MRVDFSPGALFRVSAGDEFAYGLMLSDFPYVAFYRGTAGFDSGEKPMFILVVAKAAYDRGGWGRPIGQVPADSLPPVPRFFWQSPVNKNECKIVLPIKNRIDASPADCVGLESEAVWGGSHIESRIVDTYAGRPNRFAESLQVKL